MKPLNVLHYFPILSVWVVLLYILSTIHNINAMHQIESPADLNWFGILIGTMPLWILLGDASETIAKRIPPVGGFLETGLKIVANLTVILAVILVGRFFWQPLYRWFTAFPALLEHNDLVQTIVGILWLVTGISILIPDARTDSENLESKPVWTRLAHSAVFLLGILWGVLVSSLGIGMLIAGLGGG
jgi:hypothetical protein